MARRSASSAALPVDHPEFDAMASWYDFDYERRARGDLPFYLACAREGGDPVLELGTGTGRVGGFLAKAGFHVTGVELSRGMLERAAARKARLGAAGERLRLLHGDMSRLRVRGRFGTVLVPFRAFNHLYTTERQLATLRAIRRRLAPSGVAVIDLWNPDLVELHEEDGRVRLSYERKDPRTGCQVVQRFRVRSDVPTQMGYLDYWWDVYRGQRRLRRDHAPMRWRWFHRFEFEHLLARSGLAVRAVYGDYRRRPLAPRSEELIFIAKRARR
ncbi:MAG: class I SAM-dependent methyltransferase [bacterium]